MFPSGEADEGGPDQKATEGQEEGSSGGGEPGRHRAAKEA